jgi:hypothetical protein
VSAARPVLERLLRLSQNDRGRGGDGRVGLPMTQASCRDYAALATLADFETFHAQIALAERDGAIEAERERHRGDGTRLLRLRVCDPAALARHLGEELLETRCDAAAAHLAAHARTFPVIDDVLAAWRAGRNVRGWGPKATPDLAAAATAAAQADSTSERILRRESIRLFGDSKRLEALTPWLDLLASGELAASGLQRADIWAAFGWRHAPQPLLLSGPGSVTLTSGEVTLRRPWLGLPVETVQAITTDARWLLSIENLTTFHEAAAANTEGLVVFSGGMPSPAWRRAYGCLLRHLPPHASVLHWGDIDEGGYRIAAVIAQAARDAGHILQPWRMAPDALPDAVRAVAVVPDTPRLAAMQRWAKRSGWHTIADALAATPLCIEQEMLGIELPSPD